MDEQRLQAIRSMIATYTAAKTIDKKTARAALIKEGIYTAKGALRAEFGGKPGRINKPKRAKTAA